MKNAKNIELVGPLHEVRDSIMAIDKNANITFGFRPELMPHLREIGQHLSLLVDYPSRRGQQR